MEKEKVQKKLQNTPYKKLSVQTEQNESDVDESPSALIPKINSE